MTNNELKNKVSVLIDLADITRKYRDKPQDLNRKYIDELLEDIIEPLRLHFGICSPRII